LTLVRTASNLAAFNETKLMTDPQPPNIVRQRHNWLPRVRYSAQQPLSIKTGEGLPQPLEFAFSLDKKSLAVDITALSSLEGFL
jgi:hypothetical protein